MRPESAPVADPHPEVERRRSDSRPTGADGWRDRCRSSRSPALPLDNGRGMRDNGFMQLLSTDDCIQSSEFCMRERRSVHMQMKREKRKKNEDKPYESHQPYESR